MDPISRTSPRLIGRIVGVCYLVLLLSGFDMFYVFGKVVLPNDATATAANLHAHEGLFLAGFAVALLGVAAYLVVTALFYMLFEPVNRTLSLTVAFFSLTGCVIQAVALIFHLIPLVLLEDQPYLTAVTPAQRETLALVLLNSYGKAYNISLVFFAFQLLLISYLTYRSTFLPRWLGVLVALGAGWLAFLYPPLARALWPYIALSSVGEVLLILWLLVKGVDEQRWKEQADAAGVRA